MGLSESTVSKFRFSLASFLVVISVASLAIGLLLRQRHFEASSLSVFGATAVSTTAGRSLHVNYFGNSIHELACVVIVDKRVSDSINGSFSARCRSKNEDSGLWVNGEKIKLGKSILIAYFSSDKQPVVHRVEFDQTTQILEDLELLEPSDFVEKWAMPKLDSSRPNR